MAQLSEQVENHSRERAAIKTILDSKVQLLVGQILQGLEDLRGSGVEPPSRVMRQTNALSRLVAATVSAMGAADQNPDEEPA